MTDIGASLKEKREARGLSQKEVADEIKLDAAAIDAVENNSFEGFKNKVYARAFVRDYANYLSLDPKPLLEELEAVFASRTESEAQEEAPEGAPEEAPEDAGPETEYAALPEEAPAGWSGMGRLLITFLVFIILSLVCYGVYRSSGPAPKPVPEPAAPAVINEPSVPEAKAPEKQPQKYAEGVFVSVKTFTWYPRTVIRIVVDDVVKYNQDTGPGACLEYTGKNYVKVYTDNGDHIQIRVNGRLEDSMGSPGKPVTKYYQVNTPETRPAE